VLQSFSLLEMTKYENKIFTNLNEKENLQVKEDHHNLVQPHQKFIIEEATNWNMGSQKPKALS
jgi:hypothetical protein